MTGDTCVGRSCLRLRPCVKRCLEEIGERPAVKKAMALDRSSTRIQPRSAEEQARRQKLVAGQRAQPIPVEWLNAAAG